MTVIQMSERELTRLRVLIDLSDKRLTVEAAGRSVWYDGRGTVQTLGDHAALAKVGSALAIRSNRCPNPAPSVPL